MVQYHFGDIVLLSFPFADGVGGKKRPVLILLDTGDDDDVVARITSQMIQVDYDCLLSDWQQSGLLLPSIIKLHKLATIEKKLVDKVMGKLSPLDINNVRIKLKDLWMKI